MQSHDEERDIYGAIYVQGKKYFLLEPEPKWKDVWMLDGTRKWLVADEESVELKRNFDVGLGLQKYNHSVYIASYIVVGSDALIDLFPVPLTKKVIRFYVTDDEEA